MEEITAEIKCISCGSTEDLFKLQDDEGFICRECLFSQYDLSEVEQDDM